MARVELLDIVMSFGDVRAVDGVSLEVGDGEMLCLLGPSGCGKTTLLRVIAGFYRPMSGSVVQDGKDLTHLPPERRPTAMVFQNYALFPHKNVSENVAFGLRMRKLPSKRIRGEVHKILDLVGLAGLEDRWIHQLSGGQQQRVALARALVIEPSVLLLDEPLSNLDAKLRVEMRGYLRGVQRRLGITAIFVTHDQEEALSLGDRIAVMRAGKLVQCGTPREIYGTPNCSFVADFVGKSNRLVGEYRPCREGGGSFVLGAASGKEIEIDNRDQFTGRACLVLRPERVKLASEVDDTESFNALPGRIEDVNFLGDITYYHVRLDAGSVFLVPEYGRQAQQWEEGSSLYVVWPRGEGFLLRLDD